jgi:hypothetical protein
VWLRDLFKWFIPGNYLNRPHKIDIEPIELPVIDARDGKAPDLHDAEQAHIANEREHLSQVTDDNAERIAALNARVKAMSHRRIRGGT